MLDILGQVEAGQPIAEVARTAGVAVTTIHRWKAHYGGMTKDETKRFRLLEEENRRLKRLVADLPLDREGAQGGGRKKVVNPEATPQSQTPIKRQVVGFIRQQFKLTERRACRVLGFWRSTQRHHRDSPGEEKDLALKIRPRELAQERPRFGYRRLHVLLEREGQVVNHKRVYRIYRAEGLAVRRKARKKMACTERVQKPVVSAANQRSVVRKVSGGLDPE